MKTNKIIFSLIILITFFIVSCSSDSPNFTSKEEDNVNVSDDKSSTTGISDFSVENIFSRNTSLPSNTVMQGFNFDTKGNLYYAQLNSLNQAQLLIVKATPNYSSETMNAKSNYMTLKFFGHGTNTAIEEDGDDAYVWVGCYGSCNSAGKYWTERLIGRVKYQKGASINTNECADYFYIGDYTDMHPSVDKENDLLSIYYYDSKNPSYRNFVIYKLSESKSAPKTSVTFSCTDGFMTGVISSTNKVEVSVLAHDLTKLTPIASFRFAKAGYGNVGDTYYDWQGFDVNKDKLYFYDGQSNYNLTGSFIEGSSYAYVTIFNLYGKIIEKRTQVAVVSDKDKLNEIGVSAYGTLEAEGIKVYNGKLYLGFTNKGITKDNVNSYQTIFVFNKSSK
jgi:hypothetical protein